MFAALAHIYTQNLPPGHHDVNQVLAAPPPAPRRWLGGFVRPNQSNTASMHHNIFGGNRETVTRSRRGPWGGMQTATSHRQRNLLGGEQNFRTESQQHATGRVSTSTSNKEQDFWGGRRNTTITGKRNLKGTVVTTTTNEESNALGSVCSSSTREHNVFGGSESATQEQQNILGVASAVKYTKKRDAAGRVKESTTTTRKTPLGGSSSTVVSHRIVGLSATSSPERGRVPNVPGYGSTSASTHPQPSSRVHPVTVTIPYHTPQAPGTVADGHASVRVPGPKMMQQVIGSFSPRKRHHQSSSERLAFTYAPDGMSVSADRGRSASPMRSIQRSTGNSSRSRSLSPLGRRTYMMQRRNATNLAEVAETTPVSGSPRTTEPEPNRTVPAWLSNWIQHSASQQEAKQKQQVAEPDVGRHSGGRSSALQASRAEGEYSHEEVKRFRGVSKRQGMREGLKDISRLRSLQRSTSLRESQSLPGEISHAEPFEPQPGSTASWQHGGRGHDTFQVPPAKRHVD